LRSGKVTPSKVISDKTKKASPIKSKPIKKRQTATEIGDKVLRSGKVISPEKFTKKQKLQRKSPNSEEIECKRTRSGKKYSPEKTETVGKKSVDKIKRNLNFEQEKLQNSPEKSKSVSVSPSNDEDSGYATSNPQVPVGEVSLIYSDFSDFEDNEDLKEVKVQKKNPDAYVEDTTKIRVQRRVSPPRSPRLVSTRPKPNIPITWSSPSETRQRITGPSPEKFSLILTPPSTPKNESDDSDMEWSSTPPEPWHSRYVRPKNCSTPIRDQDFDGDFGNFTPIVGRTPRLIVGDREDSEIGDEFNETNMFALTRNFSAIDASVLQASMVEDEEALEDDDPDGNNDILAGINRIEEELNTEYVDRLATMI